MRTYSWFEKSNTKKKLFKKKYGRKPNKEEIKLLRKNLIDLGFAMQIDDMPINESKFVESKGGITNSHRKVA